MNKQTVALLSVLSRCQPQDIEFARESRLQEILFSDDYLELAHRDAFGGIFQNLFTEEKLRSYDDTVLNAVSAAIPHISECLEDILFSLENGAAPSLTKVDAPDFTNKNSLTALQDKLSKASGKNYCNIAPDEFMDIFEDDTVKSIKNIFGNLPYNCSNYNDAISKLLEGKKYCISENEIQEYESAYKAQIEKYNEGVEKARKDIHKHRLVKSLIGITCLFVPTIFSGISGLIDMDVSYICTVAELAVAIPYWIKG